MSFENDKYSVEKYPYEWCLRQSKRLKSIDAQMNIQIKSSKSTAMVLGYGRRPCHLKLTSTLWTKLHISGLRKSKRLKALDHQMNIQGRNHKLLTNIPRELEHKLKCKCNHNCTLDDIANSLQDISKRTNIGKYFPYKRSGFRLTQPFRVGFKEKRRERVVEVTKKKNSCHNCGSTDNHANSFPKAKKKVYAIEKVPEEESPTEDSESEFRGDSIREQSDEEQDPREKFLVEYCQPVTQIQSTSMTAKYHKPMVEPRYHQNMELSQTS
ncbi:hypothetical protein O181_011716 [Austropuccinia psidii MF-1]|uniref:Uncharacterized protein n=1 Tax=Austropuccinia psidii MF-1 TaxID=1389203 RepID=A0A9Q3GLL1_9BASI|nr:hypothetical protein [Austropuccinia psidii MF-1]